MSETPETPEQILAAADIEIHQADDALTALEQAVIDDQDVTPEQIEQARSRRYFAGLRRKSAEKKAAAARQAAIDAEARQAVNDFHRALRPYDLERVPALQERLEQAAFELLQLADGHQRIVTTHAVRLIRYSDTSTVPVRAQAGGLAGLGGITVRIKDTIHVPADPRSLLKQAVHAAEQRHFEAKQHQDAAHHQAEAERRSRYGRTQAVQDARLYGDDRAQFEQLPARRRKPAVEHLGMDWDQYERARARQA